MSAFEERRGMLLGLAYRILGSRADAEDAVQDTYVKWQGATNVEDPGAWLTSTCTRRCIDMLRAAHRSRVEYVGTWLPEPLQTSGDDTEEKAMLASSLTTAFLLVLERLTPKERAAYLLYDVFELPYAEVARSLDMAEPACRKLVSRARANVEKDDARHVAPREKQEELLGAFASAVLSGDVGRLASLLSDDIELAADGGGKVQTLRETLRGKESVLDFVGRLLRTYWADYAWTTAGLNGALGVILRKKGKAMAAATFAQDEEGRATRIFIVRNPDKLAGLDAS